jgi:hypothetical protein
MGEFVFSAFPVFWCILIFTHSHQNTGNDIPVISCILNRGNCGNKIFTNVFISKYCNSHDFDQKNEKKIFYIV